MVDIGMGLALQRRRHSVPLRPQDRYDEAVALLRAVHYGFETRNFFEVFSGFKTKKYSWLYNNNNFPQSGPALQGCTVNVP